MQLVHAKL